MLVARHHEFSDSLNDFESVAKRGKMASITAHGRYMNNLVTTIGRGRFRKKAEIAV